MEIFALCTFRTCHISFLINLKNKFLKIINDYYLGEEWYNKKNISALDPKAYHDLLTNIRQNWIIWNYNSNESYILQEPDVKDPSMGQSTVIREIFNDKVVKQL